MKEIYLLHKSDLRWHITPDQRKKILERCMMIIEDPKSSERALGIAVKNMIMINKQEMETCDDVKDTQLDIKITEDN